MKKEKIEVVEYNLEYYLRKTIKHGFKYYDADGNGYWWSEENRRYATKYPCPSVAIGAYQKLTRKDRVIYPTSSDVVNWWWPF